ncbi:hypothetical protein B296_00054907 [Ensete ventricosum]|uniref:Uncharacterized protein n=1 Tax=Ensete ventricosum TaxID=4639 RepID=A0A426X5A2_ENSVE|nr:hypothetical protein B296_00054907 [Ensete ventricosum]
MYRVDASGNSPGVCRKLAKGIGSLLGWHKGVRQKKTETRRKIAGGSRKAYDAVGSRRKFSRRFVEGIGKLAGNAKGDHQKEDRRICRKIAGGCRSMQDFSPPWLGTSYCLGRFIELHHRAMPTARFRSSVAGLVPQELHSTVPSSTLLSPFFQL